MTTEILSKVELALNEIRPFLQSDGGDIELINVEDDIVTVRLIGSCTDCAVNQLTLKSGVEMTIKKHLPQIREVRKID